MLVFSSLHTTPQLARGQPGTASCAPGTLTSRMMSWNRMSMELLRQGHGHRAGGVLEDCQQEGATSEGSTRQGRELRQYLMQM